MIFVTVGTHEQPFDRLIKKVDEMKKEEIITEDVLIQTGFSTYEPKNCLYKKFIPYKEMIKNVSKASIIITHGGPSSFILALQVGKIPIVVPRQAKYSEHVNNHQLEFSKAVASRYNNLIVVENIEELPSVIKNYRQIIGKMNSSILSHNAIFCEKFEKIANDLVEGK